MSASEAIRWNTYQALLLDVWAMAYMRHHEELLAEQHWRNWDSFSATSSATATCA